MKRLTPVEKLVNEHPLHQHCWDARKCLRKGCRWPFGECSNRADEVVALSLIAGSMDVEPMDPPCKHGNDPTTCSWCRVGEDPEDYP